MPQLVDELSSIERVSVQRVGTRQIPPAVPRSQQPPQPRADPQGMGLPGLGVELVAHGKTLSSGYEVTRVSSYWITKAGAELHYLDNRPELRGRSRQRPQR